MNKLLKEGDSALITNPLELNSDIRVPPFQQGCNIFLRSFATFQSFPKNPFKINASMFFQQYNMKYLDSFLSRKCTKHTNFKDKNPMSYRSTQLKNLIPLFFIVILLGNTSLLAQNRTSDNLWTANFSAPPAGKGVTGNNASIHTIEKTASTTELYIAGSFTQAGTQADANNVAEYNPSTNLWSTLGRGVNGEVNALLLYSGKLYVAGSFSQATNSDNSTVAANNIAAWNTSTNMWEPLGSATQNGTSGPVYALDINAAGTLFVGGDFETTSDGSTVNQTVNNIASFNTATQIWSPWGSGISGANPMVYAVRSVSANEVLVGGVFEDAGGTTVSNIAKWNTSSTSWSWSGSGADDVIYVIYQSLNNDVYVGGAFTTINGSSLNRIAHFNPATNNLTPLGSSTQNGLDDSGSIVRCITESEDELLHIGGLFTSAIDADKSLVVNNVIHYSLRTNVWSTFGSGTNSTLANEAVRAVTTLGIDQKYELYIGGYISTVATKPANGLSRMTSLDYSEDSFWEVPGSNNCSFDVDFFVRDVDYDANNVLYAGGESLGFHSVKYYDSGMGAWQDAGAPMSCIFCFTPYVNDIEVDNTRNYVYAGGVFDEVFKTNGFSETSGSIAYYDIADGEWYYMLDMLYSFGDAEVLDIAVSPTDGNVYFVGNFTELSNTTSGTVNSQYIAGWNPSTGEIIDIAGGLNAGATNIAATNDGKLIVSGNFTTTISGTSALFIASYDLANGTWAAMGNQFGINELAVSPTTGEIYGAIPFAEHQGFAANGLLRWNPSNNSWDRLIDKNGNGTLASSNFVVNDLYFGLFGQLYVAGLMETALESGGITIVNNTAVWEPTTGQWQTLGAGRSAFTEGVRAVAVSPNGEIALAGNLEESVSGASCGVQLYTRNTNVVFPLEQFSGYLDGLTVRLNWDVTTGSEYSHYIVEKSADGQFFQVVDQVDSNPNNTKYNFNDHKPFQGTSYYRIKLFDFSGNFTVSDMVEIRFSLWPSGQYQVYPNPATDKINIMAGLPESTEARLKVVDVQGRTVKMQNISIPAGLDFYDMNISDLIPGLYILVVEEPLKGTLYAERFIKK